MTGDGRRGHDEPEPDDGSGDGESAGSDGPAADEHGSDTEPAAAADDEPEDAAPARHVHGRLQGETSAPPGGATRPVY